MAPRKRNNPMLTFSNGGFPFVVNGPHIASGGGGSLLNASMSNQVNWNEFRTNLKYREAVGVWWHNNLRGRHLLGAGGNSAMPYLWMKQLQKQKRMGKKQEIIGASSCSPVCDLPCRDEGMQYYG
jgi:hypothetical protein